MTRSPDRGLHPVIRLAPAKLNLSLSVLARRPDGFHDLHSVMVPLDVHDRLSLAPAAAGADSLRVTFGGGPAGGAPLGPVDENLVLRAIGAARGAVGRGAEAFPLAARLEKRIPVSAGLGGGSSDAAAALDGALACWSADLAPGDRAELAAGLGSDVPFFLAAGPAVVEGRGERVSPVRGIVGEPAGVLLVTPAVAVSTAAVFSAFDANGASSPDRQATRLSSEHLAVELRAGLRARDLVARAGVLAVANDLAAAADTVAPGLRALRRSLGRLLGVPIGLSGSGPTLWALYPSRTAADAAAAEVSAAIAGDQLERLGGGPPTVIATTIASAAPGREES